MIRKNKFTGWDTVDLNGNGQFVKAYYVDYGGQEWICVDENHVYREYNGNISLVPNLKASQVGCKEFGGSNGNNTWAEITKIFNSGSNAASETVSMDGQKDWKSGWGLYAAIGGGAFVLIIILIIALKK